MIECSASVEQASLTQRVPPPYEGMEMASRMGTARGSFPNTVSSALQLAVENSGNTALML